MLQITDLHAAIDGKPILKGITLTVNAGEVHAVMGPNGSGKSTLAQVLAGHPAYEVTGGSVTYNGVDLLELAPEVRAQNGVFLAFQYPIEIPGVTNAYFLRAAYNEIRKSKGLEEVDRMEFLDVVEEKVFVNRTKDQIKNAPELDEHGAIDDAYRDRLGSYYGPDGPGWRDYKPRG